MKKMLFLLLVLFPLILKASVTNYQVVDARINSLGNSRLFGANNANALFTNPAKMSDLEDMQITISPIIECYSNSNSSEQHQNSSKFQLGSVAFTGNFKDKDTTIGYGVGINMNNSRSIISEQQLNVVSLGLSLKRNSYKYGITLNHLMNSKAKNFSQKTKISSDNLLLSFYTEILADFQVGLSYRSCEKYNKVDYIFDKPEEITFAIHYTLNDEIELFSENTNVRDLLVTTGGEARHYFSLGVEYKSSQDIYYRLGFIKKSILKRDFITNYELTSGIGKRIGLVQYDLSLNYERYSYDSKDSFSINRLSGMLTVGFKI